jgi:hypothetical protein
VAFDLDGNIISVIQVAALILLTIGVYPYRIRLKTRNLIMHGSLSILALALNISTVFYAMIPVFASEMATINALPVFQSSIIWLHLATGLAAIIMGFAIVISWVTHPLGELGCSKTWRLMIPTFVVWAFALVLGLAIHIFEII